MAELHPPRPRPRHPAARGGRRLRGVPARRQRRGCTCASAWSAGTSAAATTRRTSTRPRTRRRPQHPIIRSLEPGEDWSWCFADEVADADRRRARARRASRRRRCWEAEMDDPVLQQRFAAGYGEPAAVEERLGRVLRAETQEMPAVARAPSIPRGRCSSRAARSRPRPPRRRRARCSTSPAPGRGTGARGPRPGLRDRPRRPDGLTPSRAARGRRRRVPHPRPRLDERHVRERPRRDLGAPARGRRRDVRAARGAADLGLTLRRGRRSPSRRAPRGPRPTAPVTSKTCGVRGRSARVRPRRGRPTPACASFVSPGLKRAIQATARTPRSPSPRPRRSRAVAADPADVRHEHARLAGHVRAHVPGVGRGKSVASATVVDVRRPSRPRPPARPRSCRGRRRAAASRQSAIQSTCCSMDTIMFASPTGCPDR